MFPRILEINTWPWFNLIRQKQHLNSIGEVPISQWEKLLENFDTVWLMGIWQRSPAGKHIAQNHPGLLTEYKQALPDFQPNDVVGSPYAIKFYQLDPFFGDPGDVIKLSQNLHQIGKKLIVDLVPNHVSIDNEWLIHHPEYFLHGSLTDLQKNPHDYFVPPMITDEPQNLKNSAIYLHGKDPYFPSWTDTAQINAFSEEYRAEIIKILDRIANWADGVRCDMAMLLTNRVFKETWKGLAEKSLENEFWREVITEVKGRHPNFSFIAEVYWDMEWELQQQGFDFCYDKRLYDRLVNASTDQIQAHLTASWDYQRKLVRFIENHDEQRALTAFHAHIDKIKAAAALVFTLPGAYLNHFGEIWGWKTRLPVQLGRFPSEETNQDIEGFYRNLFKFGDNMIKYQQKNAAWAFISDVPDPLMAYLWLSQKQDQCEYIVVNFTPKVQELWSFNTKFRLSKEPIEIEPKSKISWYSLTNSNRLGTLDLNDGGSDKRQIQFTINPWEILLIKFDYNKK